MQIARWGSNLAIRFFSAAADALGLSGREVGEPIRSRERALERIWALRRPLPADWQFDRDEANAR